MPQKKIFDIHIAFYEGKYVAETDDVEYNKILKLVVAAGVPDNAEIEVLQLMDDEDNSLAWAYSLRSGLEGMGWDRLYKNNAPKYLHAWANFHGKPIR